MKTLLLLFLVLFASNAFAEDDYSDLFAAGMQKYAEGQHDEALLFLYRAYATKPNSSVLGLIVRTHDFMGHCSAADRQRELFATLYPADATPKPQVCETSGQLQIACSTRGFVFVDDGIEVRCGQTVDVPPGEHRVFSNDGIAMIVDVKKNKKTTIDIIEPIAKLPLDYKMRLKPLPKIVGKNIPKRKPAFRIWVRTNLRDDPDLNAQSDVPGFEIYQDQDGLFHVFSDSLKPVQSRE